MVTNVEDSLSLVPSGRQSGISGFSLAKFSNFSSVRGDRLKYFGKLLVDLIEFHTFKEFFYLSVFLDI